MLDIGCGNGHLAQFCLPETYHGVDIDDASLAAARKNYPDHIFSKDFPNRKFDTIVMLAVIEHLPDPTGYLMEIRTMLNPGGRIVITTPHPHYDWAHTMGSKFGLFSKEANEEHQELLGEEVYTNVRRRPRV